MMATKKPRKISIAYKAVDIRESTWLNIILAAFFIYKAEFYPVLARLVRYWRGSCHINSEIFPDLPSNIMQLINN